MSPESDAEFETLDAILLGEQIYPRFQPIVHLHRRAIHGYEGLIRGPSDCPLHSPARLFGAAVRHGRLQELDYLARRLVIRHYARLRLPGRLFINISPEVLMSPGYTSGLTQGYLQDHGLAPDRVVLEITETQPETDYELIRIGPGPPPRPTAGGGCPGNTGATGRHRSTGDRCVAATRLRPGIRSQSSMQAGGVSRARRRIQPRSAAAGRSDRKS